MMSRPLTGFSFPPTLTNSLALAEGQGMSWPQQGQLSQAADLVRHDIPTLKQDSSSNSMSSLSACSISKGRSGGESMSKSVRKFIKRENDKLSCGICNREFAWENSLVRHITCVHAGIKKFQCERCGKSFKGNHGLKYHLKAKICIKNQQAVIPSLVQNGRPNQLQQLKKSELSRSKLRKLSTYSSSSSTDSVLSAMSMDSFASASGLSTASGGPVLPPSLPPSTAASSIAKTSQTSIKPSCRECGECFDTYEEMNQHRANIHSAYQCNFCLKSFNSVQSLQAHKFQIHKKAHPEPASSGIDLDFVSKIYNIDALLAKERTQNHLRQQNMGNEQIPSLNHNLVVNPTMTNSHTSLTFDPSTFSPVPQSNLTEPTISPTFHATSTALQTAWAQIQLNNGSKDVHGLLQQQQQQQQVSPALYGFPKN